MHRYLHGKMREITDCRRHKVSVTQRIDFARRLYKKEHLEHLIKDTNNISTSCTKPTSRGKKPSPARLSW